VGDTLRNEAGDEEPDDDGDGDVGGEEEEEEEDGGENFRVFVELLVLDMPCKARVAISSFESPLLLCHYPVQVSKSPSQVVRRLTAGQVTCCCNAPMQCSNATAANAMRCNRTHQLSDFSTSGGRMHLVLGHRHERCSDPLVAGSARIKSLCSNF